jgi:hypothetical protein
MPQPSPTWNTKRVYITYRNPLSGTLEEGTWSAKSDVRIVNTLADGTKQVFLPGSLGGGQLNTIEGLGPSLSADLPIMDDPDNMPQGGIVTLQITFARGTSEIFKLSPSLTWSANGYDLSQILDPTRVASAPTLAVRGVAGGVAALDADGDVVNAYGAKVVGGTGTGTGTSVTWATIPNRPTIVAGGGTAAEARQSISAVSTLELNNGLANKADLVSGVVPVPQIPNITASKVSNFNAAAQAAIDALDVNLVGSGGTTVTADPATGTITISSNPAALTDGSVTLVKLAPNVEKQLETKGTIVPLTFTYVGTLATGVGASKLVLPTSPSGAWILYSITSSVVTAPTGAPIVLDVNKNAVSLFSVVANKPTIAVGTTSDITAGTDAIAGTSFSAGDLLTVDVDQVGSTVAGADLTITIWLQT